MKPIVVSGFKLWLAFPLAKIILYILYMCVTQSEKKTLITKILHVAAFKQLLFCRF